MEINEAFAAKAIGVNKEMGWDTSKINVNGGAIAIGHPIGASGCRVLVTLIHEMIRRDAKRGRQDRQQIFLVPESEPDQKEFEPPRRQGLEVPESELVRDYLVTQETDTARFFLIEQSPEVQSLASKQLTARSPKKSGGARGVVAVDPDPTGG